MKAANLPGYSRLAGLVRRRRPDPLLALLLAATAVLLVFVVAGLLRLLSHVRGGGAFPADADVTGPLGLWSQAWAVTSMVLFVAVGWGIWVVGRRRYSMLIKCCFYFICQGGTFCSKTAVFKNSF